MLRIGFKKDGTKLLEHNNEGTSHVKSMMEWKVCFVCLTIITYSLWKFWVFTQREGPTTTIHWDFDFWVILS